MSEPAPRPAAGRRDWVVAAAVVFMAVTVAVAALDPGRPRLPRRFREVEAGRIYRGGEISNSGTVHRLVREHSIRSVVDLTAATQASPETQAERRGVAECGLRYFNFPMPGDGKGDFDALDAAADAIADPKNQPVYYHCAAGRNRSNAALAAYRMKHCGWDIEKALSELDNFGLDRVGKADLVEHLRAYYRDRIEPRRAASRPDR